MQNIKLVNGFRTGRETFEEPLLNFQSIAIPESTSGSLKLSRSPTPESSSKLSETRLDTVTAISESSKARKFYFDCYESSIIHVCYTDNVTDEVKTEKSVKSSHTSLSSTSRRNSFATAQELELLHSKIAQLELENQDLYKQFLNIQHLYSEIRNENISLQFKVDRLNEQLASAQSEKEQYVARAQRILQEKEKLISLNQGDHESNEQENNIFMTYNEELKYTLLNAIYYFRLIKIFFRKELEFQQMKVSELTEKNSKLLSDLHSLQLQHQVIQQGLNQSNQQLEQSLASEKRLRSIAEDDCNQKVKVRIALLILHLKFNTISLQELQQYTQEVEHLNGIIKQAQEENAKLKEAIQRKVQHSESDEYENRIKSLTQALMLKQNTLETVTTERNALRLQLEKLEVLYSD